MQGTDRDFEFERRFFVSEMPTKLLEGTSPNLIVQTYFLAADGYGLRIRLQATSKDVELPLNAAGKEPIERLANDFDLCMLTAKGPMVRGTRYEAERELDIGVGIEMCLRGGSTLSKRRFGIWLDQDGWVIDQFCGPDAPLIIAECERTGPVTDLAIPSFCDAEVTDDARFSNDTLVLRPFGKWANDFRTEISSKPRDFLKDFGQNETSAH